MAHLSLSNNFSVFVSKPAISLQSVSLLFPSLPPPPQHSTGLQPAIILALTTPELHAGQRRPWSLLADSKLSQVVIELVIEINKYT